MRPAALTLSLLLSLALPAAPARAEEVFWSPKALLGDFFKRSEQVSYVKLETATAREELRTALGYVPTKPAYTVFVARTGSTIDGYAVLDEELGQHEPISFGVKLGPDGAAERLEVMVYREAYGGEIREDRFRRQFVGKTPKDAVRLGEDVVAISGATISSRSMTVGVRRAVALVALVRARALDRALVAAKTAAP